MPSFLQDSSPFLNLYCLLCLPLRTCVKHLPFLFVPSLINDGHHLPREQSDPPGLFWPLLGKEYASAISSKVGETLGSPLNFERLGLMIYCKIL